MSKPVIVVTGASKGIGLAVTKILLQNLNSTVVAISRTSTPELEQLACDSLLALKCDVSDEGGLSHAISRAINEKGHIDGLILSAGTLDPLGRIESQDNNLDSWKAHFDVNFFSLISAVKASLLQLRKSTYGGRVVFVSSGAAVGGTEGWGPYNAAKAAMNSLCRTLAEEEPNIVSVAVRPGKVDTSMQATIRSLGGSTMKDADHKGYIKAHTDGKLVKPEDAGYVIAELALHATKSLSGQFVSWDSADCADYRRKD